MKDILIVLSRKDQPELVCAVLAHHGITATLAEDVQNAVLSMESHINAFLLLDLDLEGADSFLELVVNSFRDPPPYLLAADAFPDSAALRRAGRLAQLEGPFPSAPQIRHGELSIDPLRHTVTMWEETVSLTVKEFDILHFLASYPGIVFTKAQIYERVWQEKAINTDTIMVHVRNIREKIEVDPKNPKYLKVVWGVGYKIEKQP